jgi:4-hydroxy-3-polyprenylbenzoate decarboxylase
LAITGASGGVYAVRLLELLLKSGRNVHLTISPSGSIVLTQELGIQLDLEAFCASDLTRRADVRTKDSETDMERVINTSLAGLAEALAAGQEGGYGQLHYSHHSDFMAPIASGSFLTDGMVICPCSGGTLSAVVHGASNNLVQRAADVHLKEHRRLVLMPRETPLSSVQLENMRRACEAGAVILPAMPGWYHGVRTMHDLIDFVVSRILDQLGVANALLERWGALEARKPSADVGRTQIKVSG